MISRMNGKLLKKSENELLLDVGGIGYEISIPLTVFNELKDKNIGDSVELITFYYLANDPARSIPVLIGFMNQLEKEFFSSFITVSGVGPKAAIRALNKPISMIIQAIESGDSKFLKGLSGIGEQRAKQIIAKLQGKVGRFGLIKDNFSTDPMVATSNIEEEAIDVLIQLQYKRSEALAMVKKAFDGGSKIASTQDLLNEVYKQRSKTA